MIETKRIILRQITSSDLEDLKAILGDSNVTEHTRYNNLKDKESILLIIKEHFYNNFLVFGIEDKKSNKLIGFFEFHDEEDRDNELVITYVLNKFYWGKGIMPEVGKRMIEYAFDILKCDRLIARYAMSLNEKSSKVMLKIGMKNEGKIKNFIRPDGELIEIGQYSVNRNDYKL